MVRKLKVLGLLVALCASMATQAQAYTAYDGTPSSTYIEYFRDVLAKFPATADYVAFRSGQYEYMLVVGDFDEAGNAIRADGEVDICVISTNGGNYNSSYGISFRRESDFSLSPGDEIIYSNLGFYPSLLERNEVINYATLFVLCACAVASVLRSIFSWRNGLRR